MLVISNDFVSQLWQEIFYMYLNFINVSISNESHIEVKWTIPHSMLVKIALRTLYTVDSGSMLVFNSPAVSNKLFTALFWQIIKSVSLNKMLWLFRGKVDYPASVATENELSLCFVYDKQHFPVAVQWAIPHSTFFFPFQNFYSYFICIFT